MMKNERRSISAQIGHVTRRLNAGERLTGKTLELALDLCPGDDNWTKDIPRKLIDGEELTEYENHLMVDVILAHTRLA